MNREEAIRHIESTECGIEEGQAFVVDRFRAEDAWGVARLFHAIYGRNYPIDTYYIPEKIIERNQDGSLYTVVARTGRGDIVAQGALFRSSAPYCGVFECGLGLTLPAYRDNFAFVKIFRYIMDELPREAPVDEIFGEAACYTLVSQKLCSIVGTKIIGIEIDLMPGIAYVHEGVTSRRVSCLVECKPYRDCRQRMYIPPAYSRELDFICSDLTFKRERSTFTSSPPAGSRTILTHQFFDFADVARFNVSSMGEDFGEAAARMERRARTRGCKVLQFFLNLGESWVSTGVEILRERGYFWGGLLPRWFDSDALMLQKLIEAPDFSSIQLFSDKARALLDMVYKDWDRAAACPS